MYVQAIHLNICMDKIYGFYKNINEDYKALVSKLKWNFTDHCMWPRDSYKQGHQGAMPPFYDVGYYNDKNTAFWQIKPETNSEDFTSIVAQVPVIDATVTLIQLDPGCSLPWHKDSFYLLRQKRQDWQEQGLKPVRYLTFLEDWKLGHFVQLENQVITHWKAGDCWYFCNETYHLGTNAGLEPFVSMQVSGFKQVHNIQ
jgi:hypothetical protein